MSDEVKTNPEPKTTRAVPEYDGQKAHTLTVAASQPARIVTFQTPTQPWLERQWDDFATLATYFREERANDTVNPNDWKLMVLGNPYPWPHDWKDEVPLETFLKEINHIQDTEWALRTE